MGSTLGRSGLQNVFNHSGRVSRTQAINVEPGVDTCRNGDENREQKAANEQLGQHSPQDAPEKRQEPIDRTADGLLV